MSGERKTHGLTREQQIELEEAFAIFDQDGDGAINAEELAIVLEAVNQKMREDEVEALLKRFDSKGDGEIDKEEFLKLMEEQMANQITEEELIETFKSFCSKDENGQSGDQILLSDLKEMMKNEKLDEKKIDDKEIQLLFEGLILSDTKGITLDDFLLAMMPV